MYQFLPQQLAPQRTEAALNVIDMFGAVFFLWFNLSWADTTSSSLRVLISPNSDIVMNIIAHCGKERQKKSVSEEEIVFTDISSATCDLKFNPSGANFPKVAVGSTVECLVSNGVRVKCSPFKKEESIEVEKIKMKSPPVNKSAPAEKKKESPVLQDQIIVELLPISETVLNININCGKYHKREVVKENRVVFSDVPAGTCSLKFNPGGASFRNIEAGSALECSVTNGNRVRCK